MADPRRRSAAPRCVAGIICLVAAACSGPSAHRSAVATTTAATGNTAGTISAASAATGTTALAPSTDAPTTPPSAAAPTTSSLPPLMPVTDVLSMANLHTCNLYTDQSGEGNTEVVGDVVPVPGFLDRPTIVQSVPDPTAPLVVVFHAFGGCIANMQRRSDLDALSPRTGVAMLWVSGAKWPARIADIDRMWYQNESKDPDYLAGQQQDLVYLDAVFAALHQRGMHPRRVVSVGVSLGAGMALTAACLRPNLFTGAISVSGWQPVPCPRNPLSLMMVGGTDDPRGGSVTSTAVATRWRRTVVDCPAPGIRRNDNRVHVTTWQQCTGGTTVRLVTLDGVPHTWPKYTFYNVDQDVIDFALGKYD